MASTKYVNAFLEKKKELVVQGNYDFVPRRKNLMSLASLGLTIQNVKSEILSLKVSDYYKGPKIDLDKAKPGVIWEFKKNVNNKLLYIKMKIVNENGVDLLKCLSFHEDESF